MNDRYIWLSSVNEHVYLNVKEKREKGKNLLQDMVKKHVIPNVQTNRIETKKITVIDHKVPNSSSFG